MVINSATLSSLPCLGSWVLFIMAVILVNSCGVWNRSGSVWGRSVHSVQVVCTSTMAFGSRALAGKQVTVSQLATIETCCVLHTAGQSGSFQLGTWRASVSFGFASGMSSAGTTGARAPCAFMLPLPSALVRTGMEVGEPSVSTVSRHTSLSMVSLQSQTQACFSSGSTDTMHLITIPPEARLWRSLHRTQLCKRTINPADALTSPEWESWSARSCIVFPLVQHHCMMLGVNPTVLPTDYSLSSLHWHWNYLTTLPMHPCRVRKQVNVHTFPRGLTGVPPETG